MPKVYVINKSSHDYSPALEFGEIVYLSEGSMDKFSVANMHRRFTKVMKSSTEKDYILPTSLSIMSGIAMGIFVKKHDCLNLLIFANGKYVERRLHFGTTSNHKDNRQ